MTEAFGPSRNAPTALAGDRLDLILRRLEGLPTFPRVALRAADLASAGSGAGGEKLLGVLSADPALAWAALSASRQAGGSAETLAEAIDAVDGEDLAAVFLAAPSFQADLASADRGLDAPAFWRHSVAVACAARTLAAAAGRADLAERAYLCGLLHDVGKLGLSGVMPKSYRRVLDVAATHEGELTAFERAIIGADHVVFGRRMAELWRLPEAVRDVVWLHEQSPGTIHSDLGCASLVALVSLGDAVARNEQLGDPSRTAAACMQDWAEVLGIPESAVKAAAAGLEEAVQQRLAALGPQWDAVGPDARTAADRATGRLAESRRRSRNQAEEHRRRAEAFAHVRRFLAGLRTGGSVVDVLESLADVAAGARDCPPRPDCPIVSYLVQSAGREVLALRQGAPEDSTWRRVSLAGAPGPAPGAGTAVETFWPRLAEPADLGDWLDPAAYVHQPLIGPEGWVGGLLCPAPAGPAGRGPGEGAVEAELADALAAVLSLSLARRREAERCEALAGASQGLVAEQRSATEARALDALGDMAAGAAHEINNPLAVIKGRAQLMAERADEDKVRETWRLMADQAQRISDIISELMEFAAPPEARPRRVDTLQWLRRAVEAFCASEHPKAQAARVDIHSREEPPAMWADPVQTQQAVLALLANAADAGGPRPRVRIEVRADEVADAVLLSVTDNGSGMDEPTLASAFTPFFSSQQAGRGRGLGLPRAKRYVESNGGKIWIRTRPGQGTTVYLSVPSAGARYSEMHNDGNDTAPPAGGR